LEPCRGQSEILSLRASRLQRQVPALRCQG
jgi:hypothetical protein